MKRYNLRPATVDDYEMLYDEKPKHSIKAFVLEDEGFLMGMGGIVLVKTQYTLFLYVKPHLPKLRAWRSIKDGLDMLLQGTRLPMLAIRDPKIKSSEKLLNKLGFQFVETNIENEEIYVRWAR